MSYNYPNQNNYLNSFQQQQQPAGQHQNYSFQMGQQQ